MAVEAETILYEFAEWMRAVAHDPRLSFDERELAYQVGIEADPAGYCAATNPQLRQALRRDKDGNLVPDTTLRNRRRKLVGFGYLALHKRGGMGVGRGYGSVYRLLLPVEKRPKRWVSKASKPSHGNRPVGGRHGHTSGTGSAVGDSGAMPEALRNGGNGTTANATEALGSSALAADSHMAEVSEPAPLAPYDPLAALIDSMKQRP